VAGRDVTNASVLAGRAVEEPSSTLLARVQADNPEAWQRLVYLYGPVVYAWCRRAGLREADAADVGQDVFQAVFRAIKNFRRQPEKGSFCGWLRKIVQSKIVDFARRRQPGGDGIGGSDAQAQLLELPDQDSEDSELSPNEELGLFRRAVELVLSGCREETRQAFLRVAAGGQDPEDVARDLGISVNAVYLAQSRLKRRIRKEFEGLLDL
jgi:RNA polymerase sigma-70 factor, ECF subfamily